MAINDRKAKMIADIYASKACNMAATAKALGVCRKTLYNWRRDNANVESLMADCEEELVDFAESVLLKKIKEEDLSATTFFLKTKGKMRGYVERIENNVTTNAFEDLMKSLPEETK